MSTPTPDKSGRHAVSKPWQDHAKSHLSHACGVCVRAERTVPSPAVWLRGDTAAAALKLRVMLPGMHTLTRYRETWPTQQTHGYLDLVTLSCNPPVRQARQHALLAFAAVWRRTKGAPTSLLLLLWLPRGTNFTCRSSWTCPSSASSCSTILLSSSSSRTLDALADILSNAKP